MKVVSRNYLIVIDYAEYSRPLIARLIGELGSGIEPVNRIRVLLLARRLGDWWLDLQQLYLIAAQVEPIEVKSLTEQLNSAEAAGIHREAAASFREKAIAQGLTNLDRDISSLQWPTEPFATTLELYTHALLFALEGTAHGPDQSNGASIIKRLLVHEDKYFRQAIGGSTDIELRYRDRLLALAVMAMAPARTWREAAAYLSAFLGDRCEQRELMMLAERMNEIYGEGASSTYWSPIKPDRLSDTILLRAAEEAPRTDWIESVCELVSRLADNHLDVCLQVMNRALNAPDVDVRYYRGASAIDAAIARFLQDYPERVALPLLSTGLKLHEDKIAAAIAPPNVLDEIHQKGPVKKLFRFPSELADDLDTVLQGYAPVSGSVIGQALALRAMIDAKLGEWDTSDVEELQRRSRSLTWGAERLYRAGDDDAFQAAIDLLDTALRLQYRSLELSNSVAEAFAMALKMLGMRTELYFATGQLARGNEDLEAGQLGFSSETVSDAARMSILYNEARLWFARAAIRANRFDLAEDFAKRADRVLRLYRDEDVGDVRKLLCELAETLAESYERRGARADAVRVLEDILPLTHELAHEDSNFHVFDRARVLIKLASLYDEEDRLSDAKPLTHEAMQICIYMTEELGEMPEQARKIVLKVGRFHHSILTRLGDPDAEMFSAFRETRVSD
jgi:hypothetical protein